MKRLPMAWGVAVDTCITAEFSHCEDAAAFIAVVGGDIVHLDTNLIVWSEGYEAQPASESYDFVCDTCLKRARLAREAAAIGKGLGRR